MGNNNHGQLGDGSTGYITRPEQIVASNVTAISGGGYHSLFLKSDGSLWGMGYNYWGELGDGTFNDANLPEQIVGRPLLLLGISTYSNQPVVLFPANGWNYSVQMTTNLASGNWVTLTNGIPFSAVQFTNVPNTALFRLH